MPNRFSLTGSTSKRGLAALVLLLTAANPAALPAAPGTHSETTALPPGALDEIDAFARGVISRREAPGLAVGIAHRGKLVFSRGYGMANLETGTPVLPDTIFNIFSVTKSFTAAAVMQLAERNRLRLDDPISRYFADFSRGDEVTIRQLLSHTSGLKDYAGSSAALAKTDAKPDELVALIARLNSTFAFDPGTRSQYSNSNFVLLGRIIEIVSGVSYSQYLTDNIFAPARLERTAVDRNQDVVRGRATGYAANPGPLVHFENHYLDVSMPFAAGAIRSNVSDLAKWFTAFFDGRIVSLTSVKAMTTIPARLNNGRLAGDVPANPAVAPGSAGYYGLGIRSYQLHGHSAIGPSGSWAHFSAKVTNYPQDRLLIVVLANVGGKAGEIEEAIAKILFHRVGNRS